jgi:hypothetical protein
MQACSEQQADRTSLQIANAASRQRDEASLLPATQAARPKSERESQVIEKYLLVKNPRPTSRP